MLNKKSFSWLNVNGEAIYETQPWVHQNDSLTTGVWYTTKSNHIYAMVQQYPFIDRIVTLQSVSEYITKDTNISVLGISGSLKVNILYLICLLIINDDV